MSSFSRSVFRRAIVQLPRAQCCCSPSNTRLLIRTHLLLRQLRFSQSSAHPQPVRNPAPSTPTPPIPARSFAEQLARRPNGTVLYEAPNLFWFRLSAWSAGVFCVTYVTTHYWSIFLHPPPDLSWWVPHAFGVIFTAMAGLGTYFVLGTAGIVRTVRALPRARAEALHRAVAKLPSRSPLVLEVEVSSAIPLLGPRRLYAGPEEVVLPFPTAVFALPARPADKRELLTRRRAARDKRAADRQYDMDHLLTSPFRHGGSALAVAWRGIRRAISREGFAPMRVQGKKYKLDVTGGWAMENGKALDRLVTIRPTDF